MEFEALKDEEEKRRSMGGDLTETDGDDTDGGGGDKKTPRKKKDKEKDKEKKGKKGKGKEKEKEKEKERTHDDDGGPVQAHHDDSAHHGDITTAAESGEAAAAGGEGNVEDKDGKDKDNVDDDDEDTEDDEGREVIVHLENIHKTYLLGVEGVPALRGVTLSIFRGEWLAVYGTSGGGKTTLLNIVGTIDKPTKGEMTVGDVVVNPDTKDHELASIRLNTLGFVFQTFNLLSAMTARENVELPMVLKGEKSAKERRLLAEASLNKMGLAGRMDHHPNMLSGGEQQRVTIARAIANSPDLLLLDEPTGDLDSKNTDMVIKMLDRLNREEGMTLIMVTHDMYLKNFADRVVWMRDGKIQRIETISKKKREEAFRDLEANSKVQLSDVSTVPSAHGGGIANVTALTGSEGWSHTEVRDPSTYRMFAKKADQAATAASASKAKKKKSKTT